MSMRTPTSLDFVYAFRSLKRNPGFAAAAIVTIALGVGVNTGIFTVLNGLLFRDVSAPDAHELVAISQTIEAVGGRAADREGGFALGLVSTADYLAYRDTARTLAGLAGYSDPSRTTLGGDSPQDIFGALVTCNYFEVLRQPPVLGRALTERDCAPGADPVVVLSHELWTTAFASDPAIVGRTVELNRQLLGVVGVAAEDTHSGFGVYKTAYFAPFSTQPLLLPNENTYSNDRASWLFLLGRRAASLEQVRAELAVIAAGLDSREEGRTVTVDRATPLSLPGIRDVAVIGAGVVMAPFALVLLVACANVANLLLARATARSREIAVRRALGASRARVVRQLLAECMLISLGGGALGSLIAVWSFQILVALALPSLAPVGVPQLTLDASPDFRVFAFTFAVTVATAVAFGLAPALHASRQDLHAAMKQGAVDSVRARGGGLRGALVGVQVALCMVLMCGAGLLLRGLTATHTVEPGFEYGDVAVAAFDLLSGGYEPEEAAAFARQLRERVGALPGVEGVAFGIEPLSSDREAAPLRLPTESEAGAFAGLNFVSPGYFPLLGIALAQGREFTDAELARDAPVAIVSESTARNYWPGQDALGQRLIVGSEREVEVVGVVRDAQVSSVGEIDPYYVYLPAGPRVQFLVKLLVKSRTDFAATAASIRAAVRDLDSGLWVRVTPLEQNLNWSRNISGIVSALAASLGALALALAAVGIYGVVSYNVGRRAREIGVRMALGARAGQVLTLILQQTMRPVVVGALLGILAAAGVGRVVSSVLFGVDPVDPLGLGAGIVFVLSVALAAGAIAGRKATRVEPLRVLREE